jgi:hypothetical protein
VAIVRLRPAFRLTATVHHSTSTIILLSWIVSCVPLQNVLPVAILKAVLPVLLLQLHAVDRFALVLRAMATTALTHNVSNAKISAAATVMTTH